MKIDVLDCTIRDGSYVIDGQWTSSEVKGLTARLAENGFPYIEIGNGIGLGASRKGVNTILTDEEFATIAAEVKGNSKIGFFFIPGVGTKEDIKMAHALGCDFIRVGTDVSKSESAADYIDYAKSLGLEVGYNFMKSYVVSPYELCKKAVTIESYGADMISLVDSAGGMLPSEVANYIKLLKECLNTRIGFHGHNNLLLANANNIAAIENGATIVDTTLMGMGRGAGNAQTESMLVILEKMNLSTHINPIEVANISTEFISSKTRQLKGSDDLQLVMGYAQFHDSYLNMVEEIAGKYAIDYRLLIMEVSKINKENPSKELVDKVSKDLQSGEKVNVFYPKFYHKKM